MFRSPPLVARILKYGPSNVNNAKKRRNRLSAQSGVNRRSYGATAGFTAGVAISTSESEFNRSIHFVVSSLSGMTSVK